jgi:hypothetical protein
MGGTLRAVPPGPGASITTGAPAASSSVTQKSAHEALTVPRIANCAPRPTNSVALSIGTCVFAFFSFLVWFLILKIMFFSSFSLYHPHPQQLANWRNESISVNSNI